MRLVSAFLAASALSLGGGEAIAQASAPISGPPVVAGWIERISLPDSRLEFDAKLDTGADSSSLNAGSVEVIRRPGNDLARFTLADDRGRTTRIEAPVMRRVRIRRSGTRGDSRVVVRLKVCVAGLVTVADFTIADRADLDYQVLIGRNVLAGRVLVDSARQRLVSDRCQLAR